MVNCWRKIKNGSAFPVALDLKQAVGALTLHTGVQNRKFYTIRAQKKPAGKANSVRLFQNLMRYKHTRFHRMKQEKSGFF